MVIKGYGTLISTSILLRIRSVTTLSNQCEDLKVITNK